ncbi:SDR family oxidoreductase [Rhodophyticola porphyridii]|uniref:SDR family oxidoreductase n=1 Tax=Rhodophyticola porphyridii TaxID=1852017 RepID=UPI0035D0DCBA
MSGKLAGKIAVVTAAGQGIGRACADALIAAGAEVHASDINAETLSTLDSATRTVFDATCEEEVAAAFARLDRIDILVHAVGYVHQGTIEECTPDEWQRSSRITMGSCYTVLRAGLPRMKEAGGSIVTIASVCSSIKGFPRRAAYGAMKAGVIGLTKSVAADYLSAGIRANAICPGTVDSPSLRERVADLAEEFGDMDKAWEFFLSRQPTGRLGRPEEVAALAMYLASEESGFITGQAINIDGGITI